MAVTWFETIGLRTRPVSDQFAPIHVKLGTADGHVGLLGCAKIAPQSAKGVGGYASPKYEKFPLFEIYF